MAVAISCLQLAATGVGTTPARSHGAVIEVNTKGPRGAFHYNVFWQINAPTAERAEAGVVARCRERYAKEPERRAL